MRLRNTKAFTMAEALIVMTMLGIIATVMLTTLKPAEFKEKGLKVAAKKVLSEIDTATSQILINDAVDGNFDKVYNVNRTAQIVTSAAGEAKKCNSEDESTSDACGTDAAALAALYKKYLTATRTVCKGDVDCPCQSNTASFYLKDGACIGISIGSQASAATIFPGEDETTSLTATNGVLFFDTNGKEEPNVVGKDQFLLPFDKNGIQYAE